MLTSWGKALDENNILQEYPRPQLVRNSYINLNGAWEYAVIHMDACTLEDMDRLCPLPSDAVIGRILVPFSPESELSGKPFKLDGNSAIIYHKEITIPEGFNIGRVIFHADAVDSRCVVFVNGVRQGYHVGGYTPVIFDITDALTEGVNTISICAMDKQDDDYLARGKQRRENRAIWYTAQSGIWQTVWLESVPVHHISGLRITPDYDSSSVCIVVNSDADAVCKVNLLSSDYYGKTNVPMTISIDNFVAWSPENPHLYYFSVQLDNDLVRSYFGMRKFSVDEDKNGVMRLMLNNEPYFQSGLLDQGYWSDGIMTPPSDAAMIYDIEMMKSMGFNMLRKHIKIEPLRWYYHCDRLGMIVWQDFVSGGQNVKTPDYLGIHIKDNKYKAFGRSSDIERESYYTELVETVGLLYNAPCIGMWVPFNEGWGQFDALVAVERVRALDSTRPIDHASGWFDQGGGDVYSPHVYCRPYIFKKDRKKRAVVLSEFGGYNLHVEGHVYEVEREFGYKQNSSKDELESAIIDLYAEQIIPAKKRGLCACVYTQVSDVEGELNGLLTYDRAVVKVNINKMRSINRILTSTFDQKYDKDNH